jgi:hypothetical protein
MKKLLITTAVLFTALPFSFDGVTPTVSKAQAIIGRPLTPFSVAGVHRRAVRRTFGVGANFGYRGYYHRNFGPYAYRRFHPVARATVAGAAWGGGWGWNRPLTAAQPLVGAAAGAGIVLSTAAQPLVGAAAGEVGAGIVLSTAVPDHSVAAAGVGAAAGEPPVGAAAGVGVGGSGDRRAHPYRTPLERLVRKRRNAKGCQYC